MQECKGTALRNPVEDGPAPALPKVADVVDPAATTTVDFASIATAGALPLINEKYGVVWYVGQRGLSYYPLISRMSLSIHSFGWDSYAVRTTPCSEAPVNAVVPLEMCAPGPLPAKAHCGAGGRRRSRARCRKTGVGS